MRIAEKLQAIGEYPSEPDSVSKIFVDLQRMLELGYQRSLRSGGDPIGRIVQLCLPQWAITDVAVKSLDPDHPNQINADTLGQLNWMRRIGEEECVDKDSLASALSDAQEMYSMSKLTVKPGLSFDEPPF